MESVKEIYNRFLSIQTEEDFNAVALATFEYQLEHITVYRRFCESLKRTTPQDYKEIPFLPISFFKTHRILSDEIQKDDLLTFKSSGTTQSGQRSQHLIPYPEIYEASFVPTFEKLMCPMEDAIIMALLPNYLEQGNSSLVYMVDYLIKLSGHLLSGFYLNDREGLLRAIEKAKETGKQVILFGVSYALLDLAEQKVDLSAVKIMETGGMKGRRKEMTKEELHTVLKEGLNVDKIYSEYGMTELLSQGYTDGTTYFRSPSWMKILIRDVNDPFQFHSDYKTGGVNVIDLANYYSCSFIATDDLGQTNADRFQILGRFDESDMRGCNLLIGGE